MVCAVAGFICRCTVTPLAGGGTESTNGKIIGTLREDDGKPATHTKVMLIADRHDPVKDGPVPGSMTSMTDSIGAYAFAKINNGDYAIVAIHTGTGKRTIIRGIQVYDDRTDTLAADTLRAPGSVQVVLPPSVNIANGYLFIPGTLTFAYLKNSSGFVVIDSVAAGKAADITYSTTNASTQSVLRYGVNVKSGDTAVVWNCGWNYARKIILNTSASGAGVSSGVTNFPVLVRLTADAFDFTQARNNGADIRFTKNDTSFLPYEIERWDSVAKLAEVWVKVDTVRGNDSAQSITMYWGNADAAAQSAPSTVFDTATGFAGVWHLGQGVGAIVADATVNGIDGAATATAPVSGMIGAAQSFNGTSSLISASGTTSDKVNFSDSATYSVSAWVKTNALDTVCQAIVFKSNAQYGLQIIPEKDWEFNTYIDKTQWEGSRSPASAGSWHAVVGVRNGRKQYLFVDGVCVDSALTAIPAIAPENTVRAYDKPLEIGHCPDGGRNPDRFFNGLIDEVRISKIALSADWIKLCYMNQKDRDALVKWQAAQ